MTRAASIVLVSLSALMSACSPGSAVDASGTQRSAPDLMIQYGCSSCHVIPRVPGAVGKVGPPLESLAQRSYLAGSLPNTPDNLRFWIMHPQHYRPGTAMPEMGVSEHDAREIASFLESYR